MAFLTLTQAKAHLRIDGSDEDTDLTLKIAAAERAATEYLQCNVYADAPALATAIAAVPATLAAAKSTYDAAHTAALAITDTDLSLREQAYAMTVHMRAVYDATRTRNGIVINELIQSAMLLILGYLHESREDGTEIPRSAQDLLSPFRCYE
jgi:hypothetical protein